MEKGNFMIGSVNKHGTVSFSDNPKMHYNFQGAKREAERLAKTDSSKKFIVVEVKGIVKAVDVVWE